MKKRFIAATLACCLSVGSTIGAFAVSRTPSPIEDGDQRRIIASFVHGSEYVNSGGTDGAGYNFAMSGLPNGGSVKAGNFIKLYALDPGVNVTNNTVGATIKGDSLYCLCPNQPVNVNYGTGYLATAHTESALDGDLSPYLPVPLTEHGIDILRKAVAVTYVASINLKWQYVAHHGQNEWVEYEYPRADYPKVGVQTPQDITENKIACQILVWMAAMGWLDENNPEYEKTALDIFLKEMYAKYPDEASNVEALYTTNTIGRSAIRYSRSTLPNAIMNRKESKTSRFTNGQTRQRTTMKSTTTPSTVNSPLRRLTATIRN